MVSNAWTHSLAAFEARLPEALARPLPGSAAHLRLAVQPRPGWNPGVLPEDCAPAAALLLVGDDAQDRPAVVLTLRPPGLARHGGQVSLPGGRVEPGESLAAAALREAQEEIGLDPSVVRLHGTLTPLHIPVSRFVLHPFVGVTPRLPPWTLDPREVARVIEVPLAELADPAHRVAETWAYEGRDYRVPFFAVAGEKVWGATGMILCEFLSVLGVAIDTPFV